MKNISSDLLALFNEKRRMYRVDLYTIKLATGQLLRYTDADRVVSIGGNSWTLGPMLTRNTVRIVSGIQVSTLRIDMSAKSDVLVNGVPLMEFVSLGGLDNAFITLERGYSPDPSQINLTGKMVIFIGRVADISVGRHVASIEVKSPTELLDVKIPRNVYQPGCHSTWADEACGIDKTLYTQSGVITSASTKRQLNSDIIGADEYYSLGVVKFTSGVNNGLSYTVRKQIGGQIDLIANTIATPQIGDTFDVYAGCDKTMGTCKNKFNNILRYRGMPFIPVPETVA